jgi:hypothetical protein
MRVPLPPLPRRAGRAGAGSQRSLASVRSQSVFNAVSAADKVLLRRLVDRFAEVHGDWKAALARQDDVTWKYFARSLMVLDAQVGLSPRRPLPTHWLDVA